MSLLPCTYVGNKSFAAASTCQPGSGSPGKLRLVCMALEFYCVPHARISSCPICLGMLQTTASIHDTTSKGQGTTGPRCVQLESLLGGSQVGGWGESVGNGGTMRGLRVPWREANKVHRSGGWMGRGVGALGAPECRLRWGFRARH